MGSHYGKIYISAKARCPFYMNHSKLKISCDGNIAGNKIFMVYTNNDDLKEHLRCYCQGDYKKCSVYQSLEKEYFEKERE